jgi:hypothetical protein
LRKRRPTSAGHPISFQLDSDVGGVVDACSRARATVRVLAGVPRQGALSKRIGRAERVARLHNLSADVLIANVAAPVLATQEFVANGGGRLSRWRCRSAASPGADGQTWPCRSAWLLASRCSSEPSRAPCSCISPMRQSAIRPLLVAVAVGQTHGLIDFSSV